MKNHIELQPGMTIKTNYSGPYLIKSIRRDDNGIHLSCTGIDGTGQYWLNGWNEKTLTSLEKTYCGGKEDPDFDRIFILEDRTPNVFTSPRQERLL